MLKTKIEWCDSTWNPITGCRHKCPYCYARRMAERFSGYDPENQGGVVQLGNGCHELSKHVRKGQPGHKTVAPYPFGFDGSWRCWTLAKPPRSTGTSS